MRPRAVITAFAITWLLYGLSSAQEKPKCTVTGDLRLLPLHSKVFHSKRTLRVWVPPGYELPENKRKRYPVLYLNDGQDLFDVCTSTFRPQEWRADETATTLIEKGKIPPMILVGIDNAGRSERPKDYLPFPDDSLSPPMPVVRGKLYPRFLTEEVMPFINRRFRTAPGPSNTGIGGASYGAGIALFTVIQHPGIFGRLLLESPSLYAHDDYLLHEAERFLQWPARIYLGVGTINEPVQDVRRLRAILDRHGLKDRVLTVEAPGAAHEEDAWAQRFPAALEFLFGLKRPERRL